MAVEGVKGRELEKTGELRRKREGAAVRGKEEGEREEGGENGSRL
jgi:hypothetical protein